MAGAGPESWVVHMKGYGLYGPHLKDILPRGAFVIEPLKPHDFDGRPPRAPDGVHAAAFHASYLDVFC